MSPSASLSPSASASPTQETPSDNYDVLIKDQSGHDVLEGVGLNRDRTASEHEPIVYSGTAIPPCIDETDTLTLSIENNVVASAQIRIDLYYALR